MQDLYPTATLFHSREKLWRTFGNYLGTEKWLGFEFGVAYGDSTKIFLKMQYQIYSLLITILIWILALVHSHHLMQIPDKENDSRGYTCTKLHRNTTGCSRGIISSELQFITN
jgi:hypothetical protein